MKTAGPALTTASDCMRDQPKIKITHQIILERNLMSQKANLDSDDTGVRPICTVIIVRPSSSKQAPKL